MREIKKIDENSYLEAFENIVHKENYKNYEIFIVEMNLEIPFHMFDLSENHTWYNGYIVIPKESKYYGMDYYSIDSEIDIHGGFTFAKFIEDEYVIGFDTNHRFDDETTQNVDFVLKELKDAVDQIIEKNKKLRKGEKTMKKHIPKTKEELQELVDDLSINLGDIDTSNIIDMAFLFYDSNRKNFDGIDGWNVSKVKYMNSMFENSYFSGDISKWDVSNVENMSFMFYNSEFNGDISKWNVSKAKDMDSMFKFSEFNGDISKWNTSNVEDMDWMFAYTDFNGDISNWDVSNVEFMACMFNNSVFNGDLSKWELNKNVTIDDETLKRIKELGVKKS